MDFSWGSEVQELFERGLAFARKRLEPTASQERFARDRWNLCGEFGLLGLSVPAELGGLGLDALTTVRVLEAFGQGTSDLGLLFSAAAHLFACAMPIVEFGDREVSETLVPALASGARIGANAISEPGAGSDTRTLATTATRDGDVYVLEGDKAYVTNAPVADVFIVYATTERSHGYLGQSAFVVHREQPGVRVGDAMEKTGLRSSPIASLYLDQCRVPVHHRLGPEGAGAKIFQRSMAWERGCLFGIFVGAMQRQLDAVIRHARERRQFGKPIGSFQAVGHRIADMKVRLESARLMLYRACWLHDQGQDCGLAIPMAKLAVSEAAVSSGLDAIQLHGGLGVMQEVGVERGLRDVLASRIFSGTSEMQRNLIARGLGL